jgi:hypothetical protein
MHARSSLTHTHKTLKEYIWTEFGDQKDARDGDNSCRSHFGMGMQYLHILVGSCRGCQQDRATSFLSLSRREADGIGVAEKYCHFFRFQRRQDLFAKDMITLLVAGLYLGLCVVVWLCLVACIGSYVESHSAQSRPNSKLTSIPYCLMQVCKSQHEHKNEIFLSFHLSLLETWYLNWKWRCIRVAKCKQPNKISIKAACLCRNILVRGLGLCWMEWSILMQSKAHVSN